MSGARHPQMEAGLNNVSAILLLALLTDLSEARRYAIERYRANIIYPLNLRTYIEPAQEVSTAHADGTAY